MLQFFLDLPKAARKFLLVEFSERSSYYGYRALLTRFLTTNAAMIGCKNFSEAQANAITHQNIAITYLMPVVGGLIADWFFGKYLTIIGFAIICCIGHLLLSLAFQEFAWLNVVFPNALSVFQTGLVAIAIGAGGLKPNNSGLYGDQFQGKYQHLIEVAYKWFYAAVNVGSLLSFIFVPMIAKGYSYDWGFGVPGILMAFATIVLILSKKSFIHVPPTGASANNFLFLNVKALWRKMQGVPDVWQGIKDESVDGLKAIWRVIALFSWFIILWGVYEMNGSEWVNDARYLYRKVLGLENPIPEEIIQMVNALFVILLVPLSMWLFGWLKKSFNFTLTTREKIFWGMLFVVLATLLEGALRTGIDRYIVEMKPQIEQFSLDQKPALDTILHSIGEENLKKAIKFNKPVEIIDTIGVRQNFYFSQHPNSYSEISIWWQVLAYFLLTFGEVLFSIGGLELGYRYAPPRMKSSVLSIWYLSTAFGNLFVTFVCNRMGIGGPFHFLVGANYYWFFAGLLIINAILYKLALPRLKEKLYV
jgi:proton-dependent oligopeptide transporter, POT family